MRRILTLIALFALALVAMLAVPMPRSLAQDGNTPTPIAPERVLERAEEVLQRAENVAQSSQSALESVSRMLSFLEVAGAIAGVVLAVATAVGGIAIASFFRRMNKALDRAEQLRADAEKTLRDIEERGTNATRAASLLQIGVQQMQAHNQNAALQIFEEAHKLDPSNRAVKYYLGELYTQQGELERAIELLQASVDAFPPSEAALGYALRLMASREKDKDADKCNQLYAEAEKHLLKALERDRNLRDINGASFYATLGGLYRRQGRYEDAIRAYEMAAHVTPHSSYPLNNLAMLYLVQGKLDEAEKTFRKSARVAARVVDGDPFDFWARFDLLTAYIAFGDYDKAEEQMAFLFENPPSAGALESLLSGLYALQKSACGTPQSAQIIKRLEELHKQQKSA